MLRTFQLRHIVYSITPFLIELYNVSHSPATRCDTQPTPRHPSSCTFTQFTWSWPFRTPHHCPHIHDPLRATVIPVLWILFCIRILSLQNSWTVLNLHKNLCCSEICVWMVLCLTRNLCLDGFVSNTCWMCRWLPWSIATPMRTMQKNLTRRSTHNAIRPTIWPNPRKPH